MRGLAQTERYARAVLSTKVGATEDEIDDRVAGRMQRRVTLDRVDPPQFWAVLDEGALRFGIAEFDDAPTVAYQDTALYGQIVEDQDAVQELTYLWDALQLVALPRVESLRRIEELAEELA